MDLLSTLTFQGYLVEPPQLMQHTKTDRDYLKLKVMQPSRETMLGVDGNGAVVIEGTVWAGSTCEKIRALQLNQGDLVVVVGRFFVRMYNNTPQLKLYVYECQLIKRYANSNYKTHFKDNEDNIPIEDMVEELKVKEAYLKGQEKTNKSNENNYFDESE